MEKSAFQFTDPVLVELTFQMNRDYIENKDSNTLETPLQVDITRGFSEDEKSALVTMCAKVAEQSEHYPCYIAVKMQSIFNWDPSLPKDTVLSLLNRNAPALLLGYIRPYIAQITGASPVGRINIPFMDFSKNEDNN